VAWVRPDAGSSVALAGVCPTVLPVRAREKSRRSNASFSGQWLRMILHRLDTGADYSAPASDLRRLNASNAFRHCSRPSVEVWSRTDFRPDKPSDYRAFFFCSSNTYVFDQYPSRPAISPTPSVGSQFQDASNFLLRQPDFCPFFRRQLGLPVLCVQVVLDLLWSC
jgi:hypothetical protein